MQSSSLVFNHLSNRLNCYIVGCKKIPFDGCPTNYLEVSFSGFENISFDANDKVFSAIFDLAIASIKKIVKFYRKTYAFSDSSFFFKPQGVLGIRIGVMEIKRFKEIYEKSEKVTNEPSK